MLNNECHSVLTHQPIWFYSHVSAAVEKKWISHLNIQKLLFGAEEGGNGDVIISDLLTCLCYYDNTFLSSQQS